MELNLQETDVRQKAYFYFENICRKEGEVTDFASNLIRTLI